MMRTLVIAACAMLAMQGLAAGPLAVGSEVRVRVSGLGDGWQAGRVVRSAPGCLMVKFDQPAAGGYASASLGGVLALQLHDGGTWRDVDTKPLHVAEPAVCHGDND